ncbi:MAG: hypothetical protein FWG44_08635 [Oscillospiraceae bacterium]|nr:hypothetical protein [Oscillospiraceae bacterium]
MEIYKDLFDVSSPSSIESVNAGVVRKIAAEENKRAYKSRNKYIYGLSAMLIAFAVTAGGISLLLNSGNNNTAVPLNEGTENNPTYEEPAKTALNVSNDTEVENSQETVSPHKIRHEMLLNGAKPEVTNIVNPFDDLEFEILGITGDQNVAFMAVEFKGTKEKWKYNLDIVTFTPERTGETLPCISLLDFGMAVTDTTVISETEDSIILEYRIISSGKESGLVFEKGQANFQYYKIRSEEGFEKYGNDKLTFSVRFDGDFAEGIVFDVNQSTELPEHYDIWADAWNNRPACADCDYAQENAKEEILLDEEGEEYIAIIFNGCGKEDCPRLDWETVPSEIPDDLPVMTTFVKTLEITPNTIRFITKSDGIPDYVIKVKFKNGDELDNEINFRTMGGTTHPGNFVENSVDFYNPVNLDDVYSVTIGGIELFL